MTMSMLSISAPKGAHFEIETVENKQGDSYQVPVLVWDDLDSVVEFYTEEGVLRIFDGTSLRVSYQNIARRLAQTGKTADEIAKAILEYRPGTRRVGESTPVSRSVKSIKTVAASDPAKAEALEKLLAKLSSGETSLADLEALL